MCLSLIYWDIISNDGMEEITGLLRLNTGKTNIQNNLSTKVKGESPTGKVGKPNSLRLLKKDQKTIKLVGAAYFHEFQYQFCLCFNCIFNIKTCKLYFKCDNYHNFKI